MSTRKIKEALVYENNLSKQLENITPITLDKSNRYYKFVKSNQEMALNDAALAKTKKDLILLPVPPKIERINPITPKIKFVKKAGRKRTRRTRRTRKRRKTKKHKKRMY